jgi:hypothetical protein
VLEAAHILWLVEKEQVADLVQVDLLVELFTEGLEGAQAALPELDVDPVRELCADTAGGLAGRAAAKGPAIEENHIFDARRGQVIGRADAHHATADHEHRRPCGMFAMRRQRWPPRPCIRFMPLMVAALGVRGASGGVGVGRETLQRPPAGLRVRRVGLVSEGGLEPPRPIKGTSTSS